MLPLIASVRVAARRSRLVFALQNHDLQGAAVRNDQTSRENAGCSGISVTYSIMTSTKSASIQSLGGDLCFDQLLLPLVTQADLAR
jgi:hypothetical protein